MGGGQTVWRLLYTLFLLIALVTVAGCDTGKGPDGQDDAMLEATEALHRAKQKAHAAAMAMERVDAGVTRAIGDAIAQKPKPMPEVKSDGGAGKVGGSSDSVGKAGDPALKASTATATATAKAKATPQPPQGKQIVAKLDDGREIAVAAVPNEGSTRVCPPK
eukprot:gene21985-1467_t